MIQLLLMENRDKDIESYIVCPYCGVKILYTEQIPYSCPMCQINIPPIIPYLKSLTARIHHHQSNFYIKSGFA